MIDPIDVTKEDLIAELLDACKRALLESPDGLTMGCEEDLREAIELAEQMGYGVDE